jgi:peptide/nickel transport system substrate-binding protein
MMRKDYGVGLNLQGAGDPDQTLPLLYGCGSEFNRNRYCNPEVEKLIGQQSSEVDQEKRKLLVWQIERKLAEDDARPIIFYSRDGTCLQPHVKRPDSDGQQYLQRLAHGRRVARQVTYY